VKLKFLVLFVATLGACSTVSRAPDAGALPWAFNAPPADGYSISLVTVDPAPGTTLIAGTALEFKVTVSYKMSISKVGKIVLVFQDEKNASISPNSPHAHFDVNADAGVVSLAAALTVPADAKELRVFVPIVPQGLRHTTGEVTIRYPIVKAAQ
jgi:hypothetical protein